MLRGRSGRNVVNGPGQARQWRGQAGGWEPGPGDGVGQRGAESRDTGQGNGRGLAWAGLGAGFVG